MINAFSKITRWEIVALAAIMAMGLVLRVAYLQEFRQEPSFSAPPGDARYHDDWARALLGQNTNFLPQPDGTGVPLEAPYLRAPVYPFFLALVYAVTGGSYLGAYLVQMAFGLMNVLLAYAFTRRAYGRGAAVIAAVFMAGYWAFIYNETRLHMVPLLIAFTLLLLLSLQAWGRARTHLRAGLAGLMLGVAIITGPVLQPFALVAAAWMAWVGRSTHPGCRALVAPAVFLAGVIAGIAPVTVRNYMVSHELVLIIPYTGMNLFIGNNPHATGSWMWESNSEPDYVPEGLYDFPLVLRALGEKLGRPVGYLDWSRYYADRAWEYVANHPRDALRLTVKKALLFWGPIELPHNDIVEIDRRQSLLLRGIPGSFSLVTALFVIGTALLCVERFRGRDKTPDEDGGFPDSWNMTLLLLAFTATYFAAYVVFFETSQYRVPLIPVLLIIGACGVQRLADAVRQRHYVYAGGVGLALVALAVVLRIPIVPFDERTNLVAWHYIRAESFSATGRHTEAAEEYARAMALDSNLFGAYTGRALCLVEEGRYDDARQVCEDAARVQKDLAWVSFDVGNRLLKGTVERDVPYWVPEASRRRIEPDAPRLELAVRLLERFTELEPSAEAGRQVLEKARQARANLADSAERR